ncbi:4Fe-4S dicluster domain-containing protein [Aliikangiella marina]|uniref:dihydrouracil dehydrogenase (NAD(+)) n=1 Tax=Aliikangiella marina TaxID=1712262 RepID=A0A545T0Z5_9GAMM|nr:FAD-dependent oxidoreductase [Aliikangiella marina]TQV70884.1 4Fe-4S dicluster domain-containing protein [Aliikangiella marina]
MKPTDIKNPEYFHKVVDCQYACPAHTPVPEYIRLIAAGRYDDAYMINWESNVFPGILGRVCDRPCEPACRRGRVEEEPVAICRLKRVAADNKSEIKDRLPEIAPKNGKKIALVGAGPASLTVARDLAPLGYEIELFDEQDIGGGFMRSQIPSFRLPIEVLEEEVNYILDMGVAAHFKHYVDSLKSLVDNQEYDAIFVGSGAPNGRDLANLPGRKEGDANIDLGINWLDSVAFGHTKSIGKKVIVLGGGNTAMDCCRTSKRLGGDDVRVVVRSPKATMKASPWEIEDAENEDIPIYENHVPHEFVVENGKLVGMKFEKVRAEYDENGKRSLVPTGEDLVYMECDHVLIAIGQDNAFPWIERDIGIEFGKWDMPVVDEVTFQSTNERVFFGGDAAFGPSNIITAVAHGHQAAVSIHQFCSGNSVTKRLDPQVNLVSQKMGFHEWTYDNEIDHDKRHLVPHVDKEIALKNLKLEVEKGFDQELGYQEAMRCLNCDVQTVFTDNLCIECDACTDICPTNCINFIDNGEEDDLRGRLLEPADDRSQDLYVSGELKTNRVMVKDENVCLHCGLCAERCPTAAWDMQKFTYSVTKAGTECA